MAGASATSCWEVNIILARSGSSEMTITARFESTVVE